MAVALSSSLPLAEVRAVDTLIVTAIVEATGSKGPVTEDALDVLKQFQNRGFAGETRIAQTDQDRPRR